MVNMSIELYKVNDTLYRLSNKFRIYDLKNSEFIERGKFFQRKANEIALGIYYICPDEECTLDENDYIEFGIYLFQMTYNGYKLDHQNKEISLDVNSGANFIENFPFFIDNTLIRASRWEVIKYKEERGIFGLFYNCLIKKENI